MTDEDIAVQLTRIDERSRRNEGRIKALETATETLHKIATAVEAIAGEQRHIKDDVRSLNGKISAVEARPGKLWDRLVSGMIGALISGVIAFVLAAVGMG